MHSENHIDWAEILPLGIGVIILAASIFFIGLIVGTLDMQHEAVNRGHAVWNDAENGETRFSWK